MFTGALLASRWRVDGLPTVDVGSAELGPPPPLPTAPLLLAWPALRSLPAPLPDLAARYPCPPPAQPWLNAGLVMMGSGLLTITAGELLENRAMATDDLNRAAGWYRAAVGTSVTGLTAGLGGLGLVVGTGVRACQDAGGEP